MGQVDSWMDPEWMVRMVKNDANDGGREVSGVKVFAILPSIDGQIEGTNSTRGT